VLATIGCHMRIGRLRVGPLRNGPLGRGSWCCRSLIGVALAMLLSSGAQAAISIHIDKNAQKMIVAIDGQTRYVWPVSTGRPGYDTPNGSFKVNRMDADHQSQEWDGAPMPHTMFFDLRGHAIHGFSDIKHLGLPVSHGCVRLAPPNAAVLFALVRSQGMSQTTVVVSGQTPARGGEEMARRRAPVQPVATQLRQAAPQGYAPPPGYYQQPPPVNYGQQQPGYFPPQPQPVYVLRPPGLY